MINSSVMTYSTIDIFYCILYYTILFQEQPVMIFKLETSQHAASLDDHSNEAYKIERYKDTIDRYETQ